MPKQDNVSFEQFGKTFQEKLVLSIIKDTSFADQIGEVLNYNYFEHRHLQICVQKIYDYKNKYKTHPSLETLKTILKTELEKENEMLREQVEEYFSNFVLSEKKIEDEKYVQDKALDFCKKQRLKEAMMKSIDLLQKSSFDEISSVINESLKLGNDQNFGHEYIRDFEERYEENNRNAISTGWPELDKITQGGIGSGELFVVIAPTSVGKSFVLVHLGAEALKKGKTVVHYTLELSDLYIGLRYDACLTEFPINDLKLYKEVICKKIQNIEGKLIIKEYPAKSISIKGIRNHLEKLENRNIIPDLIIVDYLDLLKSISFQKEKRFDLESITEDLRALAQEKRIPVITASQCHRSSLEQEVITMEAISESFSKCFIADLIISLSRTTEDKNSNGGRIFVAKNRIGKDGIVFPIFMDTSIAKIKIIPSQNGSEQLVTSNQSNGNSSREKYKELLREKKKNSKK